MHLENELSPQTIDSFRERFDTLHDAIIHDIQLDLFSKAQPHAMTITLGAMDFTKEMDERWVNLIFRIEPLTKFIMLMDRNYIFSIVYEVTIEFSDEEIHLEFYIFPFPVKHDFCDTKYVKTTTTEVKEHVRFLVFGKSCYWDISSYTERE